MPATCAFCAIIRGEIPAVTILETERLIAFLDHRPLFCGHTLLVPKLRREDQGGPACLNGPG
jgi:histidine triad (HIT) family protein